jgi:hypothetical protein
MLVEETTTTLVAATPPTVTLDAPVSAVPVIVIAVPPAVVPDVGVTEAIVGPTHGGLSRHRERINAKSAPPTFPSPSKSATPEVPHAVNT